MAFAGTGKIWMNGKLVEWKDANIHIASHVIHFCSGVIEGARVYDTPKGSAILRLDAHMARLIASAKIYRMDCPFSQEQLEQDHGLHPPDAVRPGAFLPPHAEPASLVSYHNHLFTRPTDTFRPPCTTGVLPSPSPPAPGPTRRSRTGPRSHAKRSTCWRCHSL